MGAADEPGADQQPVTPEELVAYLAGGLSPEEETRLSTRIAGDPDARRKLRDLERVEDLFAVPPPVPSGDMPPDVAERIHEAIAREAERRAQGLPPYDQHGD